MNPDQEQKFNAMGGTFLLPPHVLAEKYNRIKAFIFDWDGVFNDGIKGEGISSGFSEIDSMGVNLLRFENWLRKSDMSPAFIISGQYNPQAQFFAEREHFNAVYFNFKNKKQALEHILKTYNLQAGQLAFVFDDVLDLSLAQSAGLRFMVKRSASALFTDYVKEHRLCDYVTGNTSSSFAVREICELLLALSGNFERIIELRMAFDPVYQEYFKTRNSLNTEVLYGDKF